jgi:polyisoprenoid-binding protein YceI
MKQQFLVVSIALATLASCTNAPEADKAATSDKQEVGAADGATYAADLNLSSVSFIGTKPTGQHSGEFALTDGNLVVKDGSVTGGKFTINIGSLKITDKDTAGANNLKGHLLSPDFFDAGKYGTASFEITGAEVYDSTKMKSLLPGATHLISGNLKLKDSTKNVTFPAQVSVTGEGVTAIADFNIDRSNWGLSYGNDKSLGDKFIRPEVNIKLKLAANK